MPLISAIAMVGALAAAISVSASANPPDPKAQDIRVLAYKALAGAPARTHYAKGQTFRTRSVQKDRDGSRHIRMDRYYRGLPVIGGDLVLHLDRKGKLEGTSQTLAAAPHLDIAPSLSVEDAWKRAFKHTPVKARKGAKHGPGKHPSRAARAGVRLVVWAGTKGPRLAYENVIRAGHKDGTPAEVHTFVEAKSGKILGSRDRYLNEQGSGNTLYSGQVKLETSASQQGGFELKDATRGGMTTLDANNQCLPQDPDCQNSSGGGGSGGPGAPPGGSGGPGTPPGGSGGPGTPPGGSGGPEIPGGPGGSGGPEIPGDPGGPGGPEIPGDPGGPGGPEIPGDCDPLDPFCGVGPLPALRAASGADCLHGVPVCYGTTTREGGPGDTGGGTGGDGGNGGGTGLGLEGTPVVSQDNTFGTGDVSDRSTVAADVQFGASQAWDYFQQRFGRNGFGGDGRGPTLLAHYGNQVVNAFADPQTFTAVFGDGDGNSVKPLAELDVVAHEMGHLVTLSNNALSGQGEPSALNESTSDIFGTMTEFFTNNPQDPPDYTLGESLEDNAQGAGKLERFMDQPSKDGKSPDCFSSEVGGLDPHAGGGVSNHFFFLLAVGSGESEFGNSPTCDNSQVKGIGNDAAEQIWFRAVTTYFTSDTGFQDARKGSLQAAADLFGQDSTEAKTVAQAWDAVNVK